jgi:ubiquinone/menaquinone biosynthesis C-methylase UbiE
LVLSQPHKERRGSGRGLGFLSNIREFRFKLWLDANAEEALKEIGVREGIRVLDYGCGSGKYTVPAGKLVGTNGIVYALDVDRKALQSLQRTAESNGLKNITPICVVEDSKILIDDGSLDLVLLIDVLQEVPDWGRLFGDVLRLLKYGGVLAVFPMHVDANKVIDMAAVSGFRFKNKTVQGQFLLFTKG